jgi:hypothetical protein
MTTLTNDWRIHRQCGDERFLSVVARLFCFCPNIHDSANTISPDELTTKNQQTLEVSENFITEEQEAEVARKPAQQKRLEEKRCYERDY